MEQPGLQAQVFCGVTALPLQAGLRPSSVMVVPALNYAVQQRRLAGLFALSQCQGQWFAIRFDGARQHLS